MRAILLSALFAQIVIGGCNGEGLGVKLGSDPDGPASDYRQVRLTEAERAELIRHIASVLGQPYQEGGDSIDQGFDSAGLIQWAYREMGIDRFRRDDEVRRRTTPDDLFRYNTDQLAQQTDLRRGDLLFFDTDGNGRMDHVAVYDRTNKGVGAGGKDLIMVYDAYEPTREVTRRALDDKEVQEMVFGRPLKLVRK